MSLTIFLALSILGLDFMIYFLFKLLYGDRRSLIARRVAAEREAARAEAGGLFIVPAKKTAPSRQEPDRSLRPHASEHRAAKTPRAPFLPHPHRLTEAPAAEATFLPNKLQITGLLREDVANPSCLLPRQPSARGFQAHF